MKQFNISFLAATILRLFDVYIATGLTPPRSIVHMLGNWLTDIGQNKCMLVFVEVAAIIWGIWYTRNDLIFEKKYVTSFIQAIFREHINGYFFQRNILVTFFSSEDTRETTRSTSKALEVIALDVFINNECTNNNRICVFHFFPIIWCSLILSIVIDR